MAKKRSFSDIFDKYKTYDTSKGFGSASQWQSAFEQRMNIGTVTDSDRHKYRNIVSGLYEAKNSEVLKKTYYKLMMTYHPDRAGDTEENKIIAQHINDVYFKLKDKLC